MASGNKIRIAFLSVSTENSIDHLIEQINRENDDFRCVFVKLNQQDLQSFQLGETYDAVVLLHSISQGRNSITDVADAKYSKLLPTLKNMYGPDRVAVVVHSMTSFNSNTKKALMMVFKKSQPTTFKCSKCVIQCNILAEMPAKDFSQLTEFLGKVPDHPLPIPEDEAHSPLTTTPSADKIDIIGTGDNRQSIPVSGVKSVTKGDQSMASSALISTVTSSIIQTEVGSPKIKSAFSSDNDSSGVLLRGGLCSDVAPTQPTKNQSSTDMETGNLQNNASDTSLGACSFDNAQVSQASSKVNTSPDSYVTQDKLIDTKYPIALVNLSPANQLENLRFGLQLQLPGKTIMLIEDMKDLACNYHMFEAIFVDLGSLQQAASNNPAAYQGALGIYKKCLKGMLVPKNIAVLMLAPVNTPSNHKRASDTISQFLRVYEGPVFQYSIKSCKPPHFDDNTKKQLFSWLLDSCERHYEAANKKESGYLKRVTSYFK